MRASPGPWLPALLVGLGLLGLPAPGLRAQGQAGESEALDPLFLGSLGFKAVRAPSLGSSLEGLDQGGSLARFELPLAKPSLVWLFDARYPGLARTGLASLEEARRAWKGQLGLVALTPSSPAQLAKAAGGLFLGFPVLASAGLVSGLGIEALPASLLVAPGGRVFALRQGDFDWTGTEGQVLLEALQKTWPPGASDPATFLSSAEEALLRELNLARAAPRVYIDYLRDYEVHIRASRLEYPNEEALPLKEGLAAAEEVIAFLESQKALPPLQASRALSGAARAWFEAGARAESLFPTLEARGSWKGTAGASVLIGGAEARRLVVFLLVGDGQPGRPGYRAIFNPDFRKLGLYLAPGAGPKNRGALVYAWDFSSLE